MAFAQPRKSAPSKLRGWLLNTLPTVISAWGAAIVLTWAGILHPDFLSIIHGYPPAKAATGLGFFFTGIELAYLRKSLRGSFGGRDPFVLGGVSISILLLMLASMIYALTSNTHAIESILFPRSPVAQGTQAVHHPAIATLTCFLLIAFSGAVEPVLHYKWNRWIRRLVGIPALVVGSLTSLGYLFGYPQLCFEFHNSNPVAIPTAILFILCGVCFLLLDWGRVVEDHDVA